MITKIYNKILLDYATKGKTNPVSYCTSGPKKNFDTWLWSVFKKNSVPNSKNSFKNNQQLTKIIS